MILYRKKGASLCSLDRAADAPFKLVQNYLLTQLELHAQESRSLSIIGMASE
jgi:hypothetical protein